MLRYAGYTWLLDVYASPITVSINAPYGSPPEPINWTVRLKYIAAGREWRRVESYLRPTIELTVANFAPNLRRWQDLEGKSFISSEDGKEEGGMLIADIGEFESNEKQMGMGAHRLRFLKRNGFWFTTELSVLADTVDLSKLRQSQSILVTADGSEEMETESDDWKEKSALYVVEDLPFGVVNFYPGANVKDPERYARVKAREMIGLEEKDIACDYGPFRRNEKREPIPGGEWWVRLHCGGDWEHFKLRH